MVVWYCTYTMYSYGHNIILNNIIRIHVCTACWLSYSLPVMALCFNCVVAVLAAEERGLEEWGEGEMKGWWRSSWAGNQHCSLWSKHLGKHRALSREKLLFWMWNFIRSTFHPIPGIIFCWNFVQCTACRLLRTWEIPHLAFLLHVHVYRWVSFYPGLITIIRGVNQHTLLESLSELVVDVREWREGSWHPAYQLPYKGAAYSVVPVHACILTCMCTCTCMHIVHAAHIKL